jgi:hypothetical protein
MKDLKDVTNELDQLQRGLLFYNSRFGVMIDKDGNKSFYGRRFSSETMRSEGDPRIFKRTGEILQDEHDNYYIVYRETINNDTKD